MEHKGDNMGEPGHDVLTEVYFKVCSIETKLDSHIADEKEQDKTILYPMYNAWQQSKGAAKLGGAVCAMAGGVIVGVIDYFCRKSGL